MTSLSERVRSVTRYYTIFHRYVGTKLLLLAAISFVTALTEGLGIGLFFGLLNQLADPTKTPSPLFGRFYSFLSTLGFEGTPLTGIGAIVIAFILRGNLVLAQNGFQYRLYMELYRKLTADLTAAMGNLSYAAYLKKNSGHYTHLLTKEVDRCMTAFYQVAALLPKAVAVGTYFVLSMRFSVEFTLFAAVFGAVIVLLFKVMNRVTRRTAQLLSASEASLTASLIQFSQSFKYLLASGAEPKMRHEVLKNANDMSRLGVRIAKLSAIIPAVSDPLLVIFISGCLYYQTVIRGGQIAPLLVTLAFLYRMMKEFTVMQGSWQTLLGNSAGVDRVMNGLVEMRGQSEAHGKTRIESLRQGIRFDGVSFKYGPRTILSDLSFNIPAGAMVAFIGESGAGKTTLVDLIAGLLSPQGGQVTYDGVPAEDMDRLAFRRCVGYVTQEGVIFEDTVANNVTLGNTAPETAIWDALRGANASSFVEQTENRLDEVVGERGARLSGGQRQRLFLARELFKKPTLLILDEATSSLDSESEAQVQQVIGDWKGKATVIIVAHRLSAIRSCDQIFVLEQGRIVETGTFNELVSHSGPFKRMVDLQSTQLSPGGNL